MSSVPNASVAFDPNNILSRPSLRATKKRPSTCFPAPRLAQDTPVRLPRELTGKAARAERYARLAEFLPPADCQLIRSLYADGRSMQDLSALLGQSREALRRRVQRLARRMSSPEFAFVALRRDHWPLAMRSVATACVLEGASLRHTAAELHTTVHSVRTMRDHVIAMARAVHESDALRAPRR